MKRVIQMPVRRQSKKSKINCQFKHAARRAMERYGLSLSADDIRRIIGQIKRGHARFLLKQSTNRKIFLVDVAGKECVVVYDNSRSTLRTFLPPMAGRNIETYLREIGQFFFAEGASQLYAA